jgi:hypothetical protein
MIAKYELFSIIIRRNNVSIRILFVPNETSIFVQEERGLLGPNENNTKLISIWDERDSTIGNLSFDYDTRCSIFSNHKTYISTKLRRICKKKSRRVWQWNLGDPLLCKVWISGFRSLLPLDASSPSHFFIDAFLLLFGLIMWLKCDWNQFPIHIIHYGSSP